MNWVGGSRTRVLIKQERRKQKEYFEKKRLKSKMKLLGVSSPVKNSTLSLDLLNLYMVNHISCQKKTPETVRKPIHVNMHRDIKMPLRKHNLELPMSPHCIPSNLCIDDINNRLDSKKEFAPVQLSKVNYSNSLVSKLSENQDALSSPHKIAQFGSLFRRLNSPDSRNFLTGPVVVMDEECGSMNERRQSEFLTEKQSVQHNWGENRREVSNFLAGVNQPTTSLKSENCNSFTCENVINLLNIDQQRIKKTFDKCGDDSMGDICAITSYNKNDPTGRYIRSIFSDPELTVSNSTFNKTSCPEKCQPNKRYQEEYHNNERNTLSASFENNCYASSSEKKGKFKCDYQEKTPQKGSQKFPVNHMCNMSLEELCSKQSWDFGFDEIMILHRVVSLPVTLQGQQIVASVLVQRWTHTFAVLSCHLRSLAATKPPCWRDHMERPNRVPLPWSSETSMFLVNAFDKTSVSSGHLPSYSFWWEKDFLKHTKRHPK
ncbi:uncharacterized protein C12orf40 homolog isoform X3 [Mustela erminea]|uniref:uncharacterized protein C12orf40 homolog isoform X3 n=1 Tax=Mustela erminea TaxID=36723 RepID=UPI001386D56E|nr:uncharacterized protein C12orf40 homolog isoform X3 [Mustela erminea]